MSYDPVKVKGFGDLSHCRVFYGEATNIGSFSGIGCFYGEEKKRLELSHKTKEFAIGLFESDEARYLDREAWVKLNSSEGKVYADISSIAKRLRISKNEIRRLADLDRISAVKLKETCFLEKEMLKKIDELLSIKKFVKTVYNKKLDAHQLEMAIFKYLGMMKKPEIEILWNQLITNYKLHFSHFEEHLQIFLSDLLKVDKASHEVFSKLTDKFVDEKFFFEEKIAYQNLLTAFKQYFEKVKNPEIKQLRDDLIELNQAFPHNFEKHLDMFLKELYAIDKFYFSIKEEPLREKVTKNRDWCGTTLILNGDKEPVVEVMLDFGLGKAKPVKTDGYVYFKKPEPLNHYIPYSGDQDQNWILLDKNSLLEQTSPINDSFSQSKACQEETKELTFIPTLYQPSLNCLS